MAAVTVNSRRFNANGAYAERYYNLTFTTGQTLDTKLHTIKAVEWDDHANVTAAAISTSGGQQRITFTGTGTNTLVRVLGL